MRKRALAARDVAWLVAGLALVAAMPFAAPAAERIVLCEEFTASW